MIDRKSKTIAAKAIFFSITFSTREIFWVALSAETLRKKVLRSKMIERMITKNEKNIETMKKRHLKEFEKEKESKEITSTNVSSMIWWFIWFWLFIIILFYIRVSKAYLLEDLLRFMRILVICDNFRIKDRIESLSKKKLTDLNKK